MFPADESHLEEIILVLFASDEWMLLKRNNISIICFWWLNDT